MAQQRAVSIILLAVVMALAACGGDDREQPKGGAVLEAQRLTKVTVPDGARDVEARVDRATDVSAALRFTTDRASARAAVDAAELKPRPGFDLKLYDDAWDDLGPRPSTLANVVGIEEDEGSGLRVVVYGTRPDGDVTVYAYASTT